MRTVILVLVAVMAVSILAGCLAAKTPEGEAGTGNLHVIVTGPSGEPLAGAKVISNVQPDGQLKVTGSTANDGAVTYSGLRTGQYEFYVNRFDYEQTTFNAIVAAGRTMEIGVSMRRTTPPTGSSP